MKNKAWWKKNWPLVVAVLCGVVSLTSAAFILGPLFLVMMVVFFATVSSVKELWENRNDG